MQQKKRKWRTPEEKYMGRKFNIMRRRAAFRTSANKIQACNGTQYVNRTLQRH